MTVLEQRYRRLLLAYPKWYRTVHGEEIVGTLLAASAPGRRIPSVREAYGLVAGGIATRAWRAADGSVPAWLDGLHLGVLLLALLNVGTAAANLWQPVWLVGSLLVVLATMRGWVWPALPLAAVMALQVARPMLRFALPEAVNVLPFYGPGYGGWAPVAPYVFVVVGLAVLAVARTVRGVRLRRRSWWWLAVAGAAGVAGLLVPPSTAEWMLTRAAVEFTALGAALLAARATRDPRWGIAAAVYLAPGVVWLAENAGTQQSPFGILYWTLLGGLTVAVVGFGVRRRRPVPG